MITQLLGYFKIDISSKTTFTPSVNIDRTILKKIQIGARERANVPQAPPPLQYDSWSSSSSILFSALMEKMNSLELSSSSSSEKIFAN